MKIDHKLIASLEAIHEETNVKYIEEIIALIKTDQLRRDKVDEILNKHNITSYKEAKEEFLDLIIHYINYVLLDDIIDDTEYYNITQLKRLFKIQEDDFYKLRYDEIEEIIMKQIFRIYANNQIEKFEAIHKSKLQGLFHLSYDQINDFVTEEVERALKQGGDITRLDAYYKVTHSSDDTVETIIPEEVKEQISIRDGEKCAQCNSKLNLEFDHIVPFSKGGTNTQRNIQLLCKECSNEKADDKS